MQDFLFGLTFNATLYGGILAHHYGLTALFQL